MKNVSEKEWNEAIEASTNPVIIDVRTPQEWGSGIISGSLLLNVMEQEHFIAEIEKMDKSIPYFIYCRSGARSTQVCQYMEHHGFKDVTNLDGGVMEYTGELVNPHK